METADNASIVTRCESPSVPVSQMSQIRTPTTPATSNRIDDGSSGTAWPPVGRMVRLLQTRFLVSTAILPLPSDSSVFSSCTSPPVCSRHAALAELYADPLRPASLHHPGPSL